MNNIRHEYQHYMDSRTKKETIKWTSSGTWPPLFMDPPHQTANLARPRLEVKRVLVELECAVARGFPDRDYIETFNISLQV